MRVACIEVYYKKIVRIVYETTWVSSGNSSGFQTIVPTALLSSLPDLRPILTAVSSPSFSDQAHLDREPSITILDGPTGPCK
jgi:hypothetical protein